RAGWLRLARVAGVAVGLLLAMGTALHLAEPGHGREDVAAARAWLDANVAPEQPLLVTSSEMAYLARFHWAPRPIVDYPTPLAASRRPPGVGSAAPGGGGAEGLPGRDGRGIYVFGRAWVSAPGGALEGDLRRRYTSCGAFETRGIRIYCLEQAASAQAPPAG